MTLRILAFFLLLFSILYLPFWISIIIALALMVYFNIFWEAVLLFFLSDLLYGTSEGKNFLTLYMSFIVSAILLIIIEIIKKKTRLR